MGTIRDIIAELDKIETTEDFQNRKEDATITSTTYIKSMVGMVMRNTKGRIDPHLIEKVIRAEYEI
jgi:Asp-tRNA(Asn)/Glu-tRNA(Gln) amidotransferase B subunit